MFVRLFAEVPTVIGNKNRSLLSVLRGRDAANPGKEIDKCSYVVKNTHYEFCMFVAVI